MSGDGSTPTPWTAECSRKGTHWVIRHSARGKGDSYNNRVAETCQWAPASGPQISSTESAANARRIVAAVNATADIPVEALEAGVIGELTRSLEAIVAMQALRSGDASGTHMSLATLCEFVRETLTKIKGEA